MTDISEHSEPYCLLRKRKQLQMKTNAYVAAFADDGHEKRRTFVLLLLLCIAAASAVTEGYSVSMPVPSEFKRRLAKPIWLNSI